MFEPPRKSKSKQLADVVAKYCRDAFALPFQSRMGWSLDHRNLRGQELIVWPNDRDVELLNRAATSCEYSIAIAVTERITAPLPGGETDDIEGDRLLALVESIGDQLTGVTFDDSVCTGYSHQPLYDRDYLESQRIFAGGIVLNLKRHETLSHLT